LRFRQTYLVTTACVLVLAGCAAEEATPSAPEKSVTVAAVTVRDFDERIEATGELLAKHHAEVAAQVAGEITEIRADEGETVKAETIVIEIDPERRHLELARAKAHVEEAAALVEQRQRELDRLRTLSKSAIASKSEFEQAETAVHTAQAQQRAAEAALGVAERALRDASVATRFDGIISRRFVSLGEFVQPGQKLFSLVSLHPIEVEFHVPEVDSSRIREGQSLQLTVSPFPGEVFNATVTVVSPTIDPRTRTLRVKALVANEGGRLRPGTFARADLGVAHRTSLITVPEEAVLQRVDGSVVFRLKGRDRVERVPVELGVIREGWAEITKGLAAGDVVLTRGQSNLIDGSPVVVRNPDGSLSDPSTAERGAGEIGQ
jgi:membrane fusion protein (multidrug efflux system)